MRKPSTIAAVAITALACLSAGAPASGDCRTPASPDGAEPPCNPEAADSAYSLPHGPYAQASTPIPGPTEADEITVRAVGPFNWIPLGAFHTHPYADGSRMIYAPGISPFQDSTIYKVDPADGQIVDAYSRAEEGEPVSSQEPAISRVYGFEDRQGRLYRAAGAAIEIIGDAEPRSPESPLRLIERWELPEKAMCTADDIVVGVVLLPDGRIGFTTKRGMVGAVPREPREMTAANTAVHSLNGAACEEPGIEEEDLETTSNGTVTDEHGNLYPLTTRASYRFSTEGGLEQRWRVPYETGAAGGGGVRIDSGSGSTPTLMGTAAGDDRFVVFTDGQELMHLVLLWRNRIPAGWEGLEGKPRRFACEFPIDFGDPKRTASSSEQSVVVRGYGSYVPNNELRNADELDVPVDNQQTRQAIAGLSGPQPRYQPFGFERIDWNPRTHECETKWVNEDVSIPNGVPYVSAGSDMVYGIGARNGVNGLEGMDMSTGRSRLWVPSGRQSSQNAFYSALNIDNEGNVWTGGFLGMTKFEVAGGPDPQPPSCTVKRRPEGFELFRNGLDIRYSATITGSSGDDRLRGTAGSDVIVAGVGDDVTSGAGAGDVICGNGGDDRIRGGAGGDVLEGQGGTDSLLGGSGRDDLYGNAGPDRLRGRGDRCHGGPGHDRVRCRRR